MALTLTQRFGTNATLDDSSPSNLSLIIKLNDLTSVGLNPASITALNVNSYVDKIVAALLLKWKENQPVSDTDQTLGVYVGNIGTEAVATRNNINQIRNNITISLYRTNSIPSFDPDDVINS